MSCGNAGLHIRGVHFFPSGWDESLPPSRYPQDAFDVKNSTTRVSERSKRVTPQILPSLDASEFKFFPVLGTPSARYLNTRLWYSVRSRGSG